LDLKTPLVGPEVGALVGPEVAVLVRPEVEALIGPEVGLKVIETVFVFSTASR
jgi:hypothetical protein